MSDRYRKKPVEVEAMQVTESTPFTAVAEFVGQEIEVGVDRIVIHTLEGDMRVSPDDWIIRGVKGEFYPCKPDIFAATYEPVTTLDSALGRCQVLLQCHRETGHAGGHEPDPVPPVVAYLVHVDGEDYAYDPADVTIVRHIGGHEAREENTDG
jgi:hypothetical protein